MDTQRIVTALQAIGISGAALFVLGFGIGTSAVMPDYAAVYADDSTRTYFALPCVDDWARRPSATVSPARLTTVGAVRAQGYRPDKQCIELGGFTSHGRSLSGMLIQALGLLAPVEHWWDRPYRTEAGEVVYPGRGAHLGRAP